MKAVALEVVAVAAPATLSSAVNATMATNAASLTRVVVPEPAAVAAAVAVPACATPFSAASASEETAADLRTRRVASLISVAATAVVAPVPATFAIPSREGNASVAIPAGSHTSKCR